MAASWAPGGPLCFENRRASAAFLFFCSCDIKIRESYGTCGNSSSMWRLERRWTDVELCCSSRSFGRRERWSAMVASCRKMSLRSRFFAKMTCAASGRGPGASLQHQSSGLWLYVDPRSPNKARNFEQACLIGSPSLCTKRNGENGEKLLSRSP